MRMTPSTLKRRSVQVDRWQSHEGQSMVEAALVLPVLIFLIFAILEFSSLFYVYESMEHGISMATRFGITGQQLPDPNNPGQNLSRDDSVKTIMRQNTPMITLTNSNFTFEHLSGATWVAGSGAANDISRVKVSYDWRPITPLIGALFTGSKITLRASSTMRNENF